jgi:hypothetical protein
MVVRKLILWFFLFWVLPVLAVAHDYPIYPVKVTLKVETRRIRAEIKTNVVYLRERILGKSCSSPGNWPEDTVEKAKEYIDSCFQVFLDGQLLKGDMTDYRCIEMPLVGHKGSNLLFKMEYPLGSVGSTLTVRSGFFSEYYEHLGGGCSRHKHGVYQEFVTQVKISQKIIILPIQDPEHSFRFQDVLVTAGQIKSESLGLGLSYLAEEFSLVLVLILAVILYYPRKYFPGRDAIISFLILTAAFLFGMYCPLLLSDRFLSMWRLIGLIILSAVVYFRLADIWWVSTLFICIPAWGITAAKKMHYFTLSPEYFPAANIFFFIGWILMIVISLFIVCVFLILDEKYVFHRSKSMAERLFRQHLRFAAVIVGIISCYLLFDIIKRGSL